MFMWSSQLSFVVATQVGGHSRSRRKSTQIMEIDAMLVGSLSVLVSFFGMVIFFAFKSDRSTVNRADVMREIQQNAGGGAAGGARPRGAPVVVGGRRRGGNVRNRTAGRGAGMDDDMFGADASDRENDDFLDEDEDMTAADGSKLGKKKLAKMEAKAEKRAQREYEVAEREERKQAKAEQDKEDRETRQKDDEDDKAREEEERLEKERIEREETEAYLKLKEAFAVEQEGFDELSTENEQNMRQSFIDHIKKVKVVNMDELGSSFGMKSASVVSRVKALMEDGAIQGVIDDRGKFIYITDDELNAVAKFINQRGRISVTELASHSNTLVSLQGEL